MEIRGFTTRALLAIALLGVPMASPAQSMLAPGATGAPELDIQFKRARTVDDLRRLCGPLADPSARGCSYSQRDPQAASGVTCVIVALEPDSFNDFPKLLQFGRETWNCLASRGAPLAASARR
jgi:hypothetical protein